jgi:hypothetical protein
MQSQAMSRSDDLDVSYFCRHVPALPRTYVPRLHLFRQLEAAWASAVTLVVAPVWAGKTLGVSEWLRRSMSPTTVPHEERDDRSQDNQSGGGVIHARRAPTRDLPESQDPTGCRGRTTR